MRARERVRLLSWTTGLAAMVGLLYAGPGPVAGAPAASRDRVAPCSRGLVALTFDDGPSSAVTPRLVRLLVRKHVPATFFMVGSRIASAPATARAVARAGFVIGNHTWIHTDLTTQTEGQVRAALRSTRRIMVRNHLHPSRLMRPPYGAIDARVSAIVRSMGYTPVLWTIDPRDWEPRSSAEIRAGVVGAVRPHATNIVLQHDGVANSARSVRAVPGEIADLRARGYCFAALGADGKPTAPVPVATVTADRPAVGEGRRVRLTVHLDRPTSRRTTVRLGLAGPHPDGVTLTARTVQLGVGQQEAHGWLRSRPDRVDTHGRSVQVAVVGGSGVDPSRKQVTVAVRDDEPAPRADLGDTEVRADATADSAIEVQVRLSGSSDRPVRVVVGGELGRTHVVLAPGSTRGALDLTVPPEDATQPSRVVTVEIVRVVNARAGRPRP